MSRTLAPSARRDGAADGEAEGLLRSPFDSKAEVQDYITEQNIPASFIMPSGFMTNYSGEQALKPSADGSSYDLVTYIPSGKDFGFIDIEADFGPLVVAMLKNRDLVLGKTVPATMFATIEDFANGVAQGADGEFDAPRLRRTRGLQHGAQSGARNVDQRPEVRRHLGVLVNRRPQCGFQFIRRFRIGAAGHGHHLPAVSCFQCDLYHIVIEPSVLRPEGAAACGSGSSR